MVSVLVARSPARKNQMTGSALNPDGDFGSQTQKAVVAFQSSQGLTADGIVGPKTWERLLARP